MAHFSAHYHNAPLDQSSYYVYMESPKNREINKQEKSKGYLSYLQLQTIVRDMICSSSRLTNQVRLARCDEIVIWP
jgi:hypothetical protein